MFAANLWAPYAVSLLKTAQFCCHVVTKDGIRRVQSGKANFVALELLLRETTGATSGPVTF